MNFVHEGYNGKFDEYSAVAQLSTLYSTNELSEMFATLKPQSAEIVRMTSDKMPQILRLTATQADAFCEAWTAFKQRIEEAKQAEEQRKASVLEAAREIVRGSKTDFDGLRIVVRKPDPNYEYWNIQVPAIGWSSPGAYGADTIMQQVSDALASIEHHIQYLEDNSSSLSCKEDAHPDVQSRTECNRAMVAAWRAIKPRPTTETVEA